MHRNALKTNKLNSIAWDHLKIRSCWCSPACQWLRDIILSSNVKCFISISFLNILWRGSVVCTHLNSTHDLGMIIHPEVKILTFHTIPITNGQVCHASLINDSATEFEGAQIFSHSYPHKYICPKDDLLQKPLKEKNECCFTSLLALSSQCPCIQSAVKPLDFIPIEFFSCNSGISVNIV